LLDERDCANFLDRLVGVLPSAGARCFAWAFVVNHVHLLIQTAHVPLRTMLARVNTGFAVCFNRRHERTGYVFQSRFGSRLVTDTADLMNLVRYVHLNPVRAGLVPDLERLESYPWSGHGALMGTRDTHAFESTPDALALFGREPREARRRLTAWMALGDEAANAPERPREREFGKLVRSVCARSGVSEVSLLGGERDHATTRARSIVCYLAVAELGFSVGHAARSLGVTPGAVSQAVRRGEVWARRDGHVGGVPPLREHKN
jgi:REP element-mobilizing transposase RayT